MTRISQPRLMYESALLEERSYDLGGMSVRYAPGDHEGSRFVDLSMVSRDGKFMQ